MKIGLIKVIDLADISKKKFISVVNNKIIASSLTLSHYIFRQEWFM